MNKNLLFQRYALFVKLIIALIILLSTEMYSAYISNFPIAIKQPTGESFDVLATGDEFYNWIHDADGFTIIQDPQTGFYTYAQKSGDILISSNNIVGKANPIQLGIQKWLKFSDKAIKENMREFISTVNMPRPTLDNKKSSSLQFNSGTINNIVTYIRFSDEAEWTDNNSTFDNMFNAMTGNSMYSYFKEASYDLLGIVSTFYPTPPSSTVISYQDSHPRGYYQPYNASTNTIGYTGGDGGSMRRDREHSLLVNCVNAISSQVPSSLNIDFNNDGYVDNVCFMVSGTPGAWASLLWPHRWSLYSQTVNINGKRVYDYNFQIRSMTLSSGNGVLCHEMFHTLGSPDLYHYTSNGIAPVYSWDLMENNANPPQHMGAFMKFKYGGWISSIPEITTAGTYTLNQLTQPTGNCYKIKSPNSTTEYFVVEYRKKSGTFENSIPGSGLIVYRINPAASGNADGPPDEVYIYRPGGTTTANGTPANANFSSDVSRVAINNTTNLSAFLANGSAGYLDISEVSSAGTTISFKVGFGTPTIPTLMLPANNSTLVPLKPDFSWSAFTGATSYALQVSQTTDFATKVIDRTGISGTTFTPTTDLNYNATYYWRVNATTGTGTTGWSNTFTFSTIPSIKIDSIVGTMCAGYPFAVYYTAGITFSPINAFTVQLSDTLGNFNRPVNVGWIASNVSGVISCQMPDTMPGGSKYRMRIYANNPETYGINNGKDITITPALSPFANGLLEVCEFSTLPYQTSNIPNVSDKWTIIGGTLLGKPDSSIIKIQWGAAGTGKIKLVKRSVLGCTDSVTLTVKINPIPTPEFIGNLNVCKNSIEFYTADLDADTKNIWTVKGGKIMSIVSDKMVKIAWDTMGKGSVTLTQIIGPTKCSSVLTKEIIIAQLPDPDSISGITSVCPFSEVIYHSNAKAGTVNSWFVQNGTIIGSKNSDSLLVSWNTSGTGSVKLIQTLNSTGCKDTLIKNITINPVPEPSIQGNYKGCSNLVRTYRTIEDNLVANLWEATNGQIIGENNLDSVSVIWGNSGAGKLSLIQTIKKTGCFDTTTYDIVINPQPPQPTISRTGDILSSSASDGNQWYAENIKIEGANSKDLSPNKNGSYSVDVTLFDCVSERSTPYSYISSNVQEIEIIDGKVSIHPNPTDGIINLVLLNSKDSKISIKVMNLLGIGLITKELAFQETEIEKIDLTMLPDGVYSVLLTIDGKQFVRKVILRK